MHTEETRNVAILHQGLDFSAEFAFQTKPQKFTEPVKTQKIQCYRGILLDNSPGSFSPAGLSSKHTFAIKFLIFTELYKAGHNTKISSTETSAAFLRSSHTSSALKEIWYFFHIPVTVICPNNLSQYLH